MYSHVNAKEKKVYQLQAGIEWLFVKRNVQYKHNLLKLK